MPITTFYRLTIVSLYKHLYTKYIQITYNITYKGSLDFGIPGVTRPTTFKGSRNYGSDCPTLVLCLLSPPKTG